MPATNTTAVQSTLIVTNVKLSIADKTERLHRVKYTIQSEGTFNGIIVVDSSLQDQTEARSAGILGMMTSSAIHLPNDTTGPNDTTESLGSWHSLGNKAKVCHDDSNN